MRKIFRWLHSFFATVIVGAALVVIYVQSHQIMEKMGQRGVPDQLKETNAQAKPRVFFSVTDLVIPVYMADSSFRRIVMSFRMVSTEEQIKAYFGEEENIPLLYDRLNAKLAPMALEFPLEEEGKRIIKEKIRSEINQLVRELDMEGEIEEVYIEHILAA